MASMELALAALHSADPGEKPNISLVARTYGVSQSGLYKRFHGVTGSKEEQYDKQRILTTTQSRALIKWINQLTERGLPPTNSMLANFAREISGKEPGKNWASRWLKAHSDKGFMLGVSTKRKRIFTRRKYEQGGYKQHLQDGNREWITTIGCICANGTALAPSLIYMAKSGFIQDSWLQDYDPQTQRCFFAASESGWTNNDIGYRWLVDVFDKETKSQASRGWRLLILDGHGSHVTMKFIEYCDSNRILLAIFPAHATHTLQPLDVALFSPLSNAYTKQLDDFIRDSQGFTRLTKRDFFRLFWASWNEVFISKNINSAFRTTGLYPFDPEIVINKFNKKITSRPFSSESGASIIPPEDWRRLEKLVKTVVNNIYDEKAVQLRETVSHLSTQLILLQNENQGLKRALINAKKPKNKKQPLLLGLPSEQDGGALFMSPTKVQQARDIISQKNDEAAQKQAHKDDKKLQQQLKKQAKEAEKVKRAQIRQEKREQREQEAAEKQRLKDEQELAKLADLQLQNDVISTPKASKKPTEQISRQAKPRVQPEAHVEDNEVVVTTNRRGRAIRPPARFRD
ncbi:pogo transposable element, putative [Talaromyces stipitatus ATCC 10500]|uniref:Pogo transposable element, putative n=1 Tax=Talaromyces stipitatus (strain ATCC 10500 / CBS 375.48 / QM 6759 / NRRL 1006) TaxID=441959 RepID=B8MU49_TALSN|nr:pogo transposable element, putative [Talaromyces stipitatus ATCC 10500]EED12682.1 pogo transposable element, putative [Talaromyces stipitatus ATCC 10500]